MRSVSMHEAKTHLSRLVAEVEQGEEVIVRRGSVPVAKIVGYQAPRVPRRPGSLVGQITMADDFDDIPPEFDDYLV